jgi:hypothetical protein
MMTKEPRLDWIQVAGVACLYLGYLLFLSVLHLLAINSGGSTATVLNGLFVAFTGVFIAMVIFGFVFLIIRLLSWLTWVATQPDWFKAEMKNKK